MNPTDKPPVVLRDRRRDPIEDEVACAEAIRAANWFAVIDIPEAWPVDTATAEALLREAGGFDLSDGELSRLVTCGVLPPPAEDEGGPEWSAADIIEVARVLEGRRQWRVDSPHSAKMLHQEMILHAARRDGAVDEIAAPLAATTDLLQLVSNMVMSESREQRLLNAVVLRLLLEHQHGVRV